jgi:hypothetical protein
MTDKYILLDPTGINLVLVPQGEPLVLEPGTTLYNAQTVGGQSITGASELRFNFEFSCDLSEDQAKQLEALARWQETTGRGTEIVAYYAWDTFAEMSPQTRENVPGVDPVEAGPIVTYYPVIQGDVVVKTVLIGHNVTPRYRCSVQFIEGTIRRP